MNDIEFDECAYLKTLVLNVCLSKQRYCWMHFIQIRICADSHAPCGLRGCKNGPAPFPGRMSYKATKPGLALSVVYLSMFYCIVVY